MSAGDLPNLITARKLTTNSVKQSAQEKRMNIVVVLTMLTSG